MSGDSNIVFFFLVAVLFTYRQRKTDFIFTGEYLRGPLRKIELFSMADLLSVRK